MHSRPPATARRSSTLPLHGVPETSGTLAVAPRVRKHFLAIAWGKKEIYPKVFLEAFFPLLCPEVVSTTAPVNVARD